ncbi:hypothetical protein ACFIQG_12940 [Comamonas odontotermitis]|uniref:hypothetical protein n=1 Tax=Comamonas odontotermitis TaxID=379895 RepID=UPI00366C27AB
MAYAIIIFFASANLQVCLAQTKKVDIASSEHFLSVLKEEGYTVGDYVWQRYAYRYGYTKINGLSKLKFTGVDVRKIYWAGQSNIEEEKRDFRTEIFIMLETEDDEKLSYRLSLSNIYYIGEMGRLYPNKYPKEWGKWNKKTIDSIKSGIVDIGMTSGQVMASWGFPTSINTTSIKNHTSEQWVYGNYPDSSYLYFNNGKLTAIQN